jgi:hypothetical protein
MNDKDRQEVLDLIASDRDLTLAREWPNKLEWFMCPECKTQTLAMKFIPKSKFPNCSMEFGGHTTYGFIEMTHMTMIGRQCIICKKKFIQSIPPSQPENSYIEGE